MSEQPDSLVAAIRQFREGLVGRTRRVTEKGIEQVICEEYAAACRGWMRRTLADHCSSGVLDDVGDPAKNTLAVVRDVLGI